MSRKFSSFLSLLTVCIMLCGCGREKLPYLSAEERLTLEQELVGSISYSSTSNQLSIKGSSKYDIYELSLRCKDSDTFSTNVHELPSGTGCSINIPADTFGPLENSEFYISYNIGAYNYSTGTFHIPVQTSDVPPLEIYVETNSGPLLLSPGETLEFEHGNEINGITHGRIYSLSCDAEYIPYNTGYYLTIEAVGSDPNNEICYRLKDTQGIVSHADSLFFYRENATLYFYDGNGVSPGRYTLEFMELD